MNIIFGDTVKNLPKGYTVLELDTINLLPSNKKIKTYCAVEKIPMEQLMSLDNDKINHATLIDQYRQKNWEGCRKLIGALKGRWGGEVDSFYETLEQRISEFEQSAPPADWDGALTRTS